MEVQENDSNYIHVEIIRVEVVGDLENEVGCDSESSEQMTVGPEQVNVGLEHSISNATSNKGRKRNNATQMAIDDFNKNRHDSHDLVLETEKSKQKSVKSDTFECCGSDSKADYECRFCDYKTECKHLLKCHWKVNHQSVTGMKRCAIEWFHCELCDYKAKFKHYVKAHVAYKHKNSEPLICEFCAHKVRNKQHLDRHIQLNHTENFVFCYCEFCGEKLRDKSYLTRHINARHKENSEWHNCQLCEYKTKWKSALKVHMKSKHKETVTANNVSPVRVEQTEVDWMGTW